MTYVTRMESGSVSSAAEISAPCLNTLYVPLEQKYHRNASVLCGMVGNDPKSLPKSSSVTYINFFHSVMKARSIPAPFRFPDLSVAVTVRKWFVGNSILRFTSR